MENSDSQEHATAHGAKRNDENAASGRAPIEARLMRVIGGAMERSSWSGCRRTGAWIGLAFFRAAQSRRHIAVANVRLAFPHLSEAAARQIARRSAQNFAMTFCEFLHLRVATPQEVRDYSWIEGGEHIEAALARGRGAVLLTGHLGNWEVMGARVAQQFPLTAMSRATSNRGVQQHLAEIRHVVGMNIISKFDTARTSLKTLRANGALAIFADQHGGRESPLLPMFGHDTRVVTALARLALMSGAPIVAGFGVRRTPWLQDGRIVARAGPSLDVRVEDGFSSRDHAARERAVLEATRWTVEQTENVVRRNPDQWLWMHRRWRPEEESPDFIHKK